jgi:glutathione synthase/RimK-type ligase-like ATP-grasp enzyme
MKQGKILAICCRVENYNDFLAIAKLIIKKAPEIIVVIKPIIYHPDELDPQIKNFPLLNIYLVNPPQIIPSRGKTLFVERIDKYEQTKQYAAAGIATPKTIEYEPDQLINKNDWGEYLFLKDKSSSGGQNCFLVPSKYILNIKCFLDKAQMPNEVLLQEFIYTGKNVNHYRVLNFLGRPLCCYKSTNLNNIVFTTSLDNILNNHTAKTNYSKDSRKIELSDNIEVLKFSEKVFNIFPDKPLQGIDIVIEKNTNKLFVLEANLGGNVWDLVTKNHLH